jgi:purine-nucleoside phosphorylase
VSVIRAGGCGGLRGRAWLRRLTIAEQAESDLEAAKREVDEAQAGTERSKAAVLALKEALKAQQVSGRRQRRETR